MSQGQLAVDNSFCMAGEIMLGSTKFEIFAPDQVAVQFPEFNDLPIWLYRYSHQTKPWQLSIATYGTPDSGSLSLGGFRILPEERCSLPGFSVDKEALGLAFGMEKKVHWSRVAGIGGPKGRAELGRIVGGKCVLKPSVGNRVGEAGDFDLLDFAVECFKDFEARSGVFLTTGQDLGHGLMSDGKTSSIDCLNSKFFGCISSNTSLPTAWGNLSVIEGVMEAFGAKLDSSLFGIYGCGNIGRNVLDHLLDQKASVTALDASPAVISELSAKGIDAFAPDKREQFLSQEIDVIVINANGSTLDAKTNLQLANNKNLKLICGCENLMLVDPEGRELFRNSKKIFCPPEYCGMMGYLTAVEEYLTSQAGEEWNIQTMWEPSRLLKEHSRATASRVLEGDFSSTFEQFLG